MWWPEYTKSLVLIINFCRDCPARILCMVRIHIHVYSALWNAVPACVKPSEGATKEIFIIPLTSTNTVCHCPQTMLYANYDNRYRTNYSVTIAYTSIALMLWHVKDYNKLIVHEWQYTALRNNSKKLWIYYRNTTAMYTIIRTYTLRLWLTVWDLTVGG